MFWEYAIRKTKAEDEDRFWDKFGRHIGTIWHREDFKEGQKGKPHNPDMLFYPLSLTVSPHNLYKQLKQDFNITQPKIAEGEYKPTEGEEVVEMANMSYEDFRDFMDNFQKGLGE